MQRGGRTSEKNQNHKPDVTAPVCSARGGASARITHHARGHTSYSSSFHPAECTAARCEGAATWPLSPVSISHVFRSHTVKESSLFSQSFAPDTQQRKSLSALRHYFHLRQVVLPSEATPTLLANVKPLTSRKICFNIWFNIWCAEDE